LAIADLPPEASIRNKLEAIHSSGERARELVTQILAFSRKDEQVRSPVEMHLILEDALKLLRPAIPTTIEIQTQITSKCRIIGDPSRIHQIIMNLCTNAYQAMLETGGTLKIRLSHREMKGKAAALAQVPAGSYGKLVISDTGIGIPSENLDRIFNPYFTTKDKGKGTGLGLAAVHGICMSHGGSILVESQIGKGTTFIVYLPLTQDKNDKVKQADLLVPGGNERIMLVDDEHDIREIEKEMLETQGYIVTVKNNAKEALTLFAKQPEQFDLVITDMTMPNMTGDRLAGELIKIRADIPIILSTGYSELMSKEKATSLGIKAFLMKPFTMRDLLKIIRKVFDDILLLDAP
jgi:CheY-like chemotaxis protein